MDHPNHWYSNKNGLRPHRTHVKGNVAYISTCCLGRFSGLGCGGGDSSRLSASTKFSILLLSWLMWFFFSQSQTQLLFPLIPFVDSPFLQRVWDNGDCIASEHGKFFKTKYEIFLLISRLRYSHLFPPVWEFLLSPLLLDPSDFIVLDPLPPALCLYLPISSIILFCPHHHSLPLETYFAYIIRQRNIFFLGLMVFLWKILQEPPFPQPNGSPRHFAKWKMLSP